MIDNTEDNSQKTKTIIALRGRANSGKSETIRLLHGLLLEDNYQLVNTNLPAGRGDFNSIFSKQGKLVGITSSGDDYDLVHDHLQELIDANCSICVCACRTFDRIPPGTNAAIREFTGYRNQFIEKTIDQNIPTRTAYPSGKLHISGSNCQDYFIRFFQATGSRSASFC